MNINDYSPEYPSLFTDT